MSLQASDAEAAAVAVAPRVSLEDIRSAILARVDTTGDRIGKIPFAAQMPSGDPESDDTRCATSWRRRGKLLLR